MNLNKIVAICEELKILRTREEELRKQLIDETLEAKKVIPANPLLAKERHEQKFTTIPFTPERRDIEWGAALSRKVMRTM